MKIENDDLLKLKLFVSTYSDYFKRMSEIETRIIAIDKEREELLIKVNVLKVDIGIAIKKENEFKEELTNKYGELDLASILKNSEN